MILFLVNLSFQVLTLHNINSMTASYKGMHFKIVVKNAVHDFFIVLL